MVVLVNRFKLHVEPETFEEVFKDSSVFMCRQKGFINHTLVRSLSDPTVYVNIAEWTDAGAHREAVSSEGFLEHIAALATVATPDPDLFSVVSSVEALDA